MWPLWRRDSVSSTERRSTICWNSRNTLASSRRSISTSRIPGWESLPSFFSYSIQYTVHDNWNAFICIRWNHTLFFFGKKQDLKKKFVYFHYENSIYRFLKTNLFFSLKYFITQFIKISLKISFFGIVWNISKISASLGRWSREALLEESDRGDSGTSPGARRRQIRGRSHHQHGN